MRERVCEREKARALLDLAEQILGSFRFRGRGNAETKKELIECWGVLVGASRGVEGSD